MLWSDGLAEKSAAKLVVRLGHRATDETEPRRQWPTGFRHCAPRVPGGGRASPLLCPRRPRRAWARLQVASTRPLLSAPSFRFSRLSFATHLAAAAATPVPRARHRHWRRQLAPSSSIPTATLHRLPSNPCALPCPLLALGKPQRRALARRSSAANLVVVATPF